MQLTRRGEIMLAFAAAFALTFGALAYVDGVRAEEPIAIEQRYNVDLPVGSWIVSETEARGCLLAGVTPSCPSAGHLVVDCDQTTIWCDDEAS